MSTGHSSGSRSRTRARLVFCAGSEPISDQKVRAVEVFVYRHIPLSCTKKRQTNQERSIA